MLKITNPNFVRVIKTTSICFFQETYLAPGEEQALILPPGFHVVAKSRPWRSGVRLPGGGVAAIIANDVDYKVCEAISGPDLLVLDLGSLYIINAYLLPSRSDWTKWSVVDPELKLAEALAFCRAEDSAKPVLLMGDLNARTASRQAHHSPLVRSSPDLTCDTRGNWVLQLCDDNDLQILNGSVFDLQGPQLGCGDGAGWTSFQPLGRSVIDYAIASQDMLEMVDYVNVEHTLRYRSDHAPVFAVLRYVKDCEAPDNDVPVESLPIADIINSIDPTCDMLEDALLATLNSALHDDDATRELYGPCYFTQNPTSFYVATAAATGFPNATVCVYWRENSHCVKRTRGSAERAAIIGVIVGLLQTSPNAPVVIYLSSEYVIRALVYLAGRYSLHGWRCQNADILQVACTILQRRAASTVFRLVKSKAEISNLAWLAATRLAKDAITNPSLLLASDPVMDDVPLWSYPAGATPLSLSDSGSLSSKVTANIEKQRPMNLPLPAETAMQDGRVLPPTDVDPASESHRGRWWDRKLMWMNLQKLVTLSKSSMKLFWKFLRRRTDPKPRSIPVSLEQLRTTFQTRMNPPPVLPEQFDANKFHADEEFLKELPTSTEDVTPERFFSRPFTVEEVELVKLKLQTHLHSATGLDGVKYADILSIPSQNLVDLFNLCVSTMDAPRVWLSTMLVGILKPGRPAKDPDSYRIIALESCLLKMLTLLIAQRFRGWLEARNILPEAQNGFRPGFRGINCAYVLRCSIDRTMARGKTLVAVFVDLVNAFPSTNLPTLWKKLADAGATGPLMDWMRMLYDRMQYTVTTPGEDRKFSDVFKSWWGILAGDSHSPDFFAFFASDCTPPQTH
ncbi:hypothetical protein CVT26_012897 [Gymnopilus dilepis]|uniref:Endonuclease/exonuclease/phosphatase domain-containing protein n=1 Tax=Gymnopilus dilepis TaxID=231916 RepID=A0A409WD98_9AGAR|nr:hypothetical protein CVT26_012897 [Gymnopilus dilepis]